MAFFANPQNLQIEINITSHGLPATRECASKYTLV
jgi:hypothetical protein